MAIADLAGARLGRWVASWEYPGYLEWSHPSKQYLVQATPDWDAKGTISIESTDRNGSLLFGGPSLRYSGSLTRKKYLKLVQPWLELPPSQWAQAQVGGSLFPQGVRRLEENPKRPPREWWYRCTAGVKESNRLYSRSADPQEVCGSLWYHKMGSAKKRQVLKRYERRLEENPPRLTEAQSRRRVEVLRRSGCAVKHVKLSNGDIAVMKKCPPQLAENPLGSGQAVLLVAAAFGLGWFLQTRKAKAAAAVCKVDSVVELNKWAATNGYGLMYFPAAKTTEPPTLPELLKDATWGGPVQKIKDAYGEEKVLLVLNENDPIFYLYKDGKPVAAPAVKASYCQSR